MPLNTSPGLSPQEQSLISAATPSSPSSSQASPPGGPQASSPSPSGSSSAYPSGIDQSVVALMHGIKSNEGANGNYNATGDKGTAAGIGMWSNETNGIPEALQPGQIPANFAGQAKQYGLDPTDFSPANQNQVMYSTLAAEKKAGLTPEQILSKWNSGNPNAFLTNPVMKAATSSTGTQNVASYVQRGMAAAQAYAKQNQQQSAQQTPSSGSPANNSIPTVDSIGSLLGQGNYMGALGKGAADLTNFAFPIVGDVINDIKGSNTKTGLQQAGDAGLSILPFVPGLGEVGETARGAELGGEAAAEAPGLISKLMGSNLVKGAALGYGTGALGNLAQGQSLEQAISPNMGTLGGAALGGAANAILPKIFAPFAKNLTAGGAQAALDDSLATEAGRLKPTQKILANMPNAGADALKVISRTPDALPEVVDNHHFNTQQGQQIMQQRQGQLSQLRAQALTKMGAAFDLNDLQTKAQALLQEQSPNAPDLLARNEQIAQTIAGYTKNYGGTRINPLQMEAIKETGSYADPIARAARASLEETTEKSGAPDLRALNKQIQAHINAKAVLEKMDGQVVKGGRLGNMLRGHTTAAVGAMAASAMGGGWMGTIGGALAGEGVSKLLSHWSANTALTTPLQESLLERLAQEDPQIVQQYAKYVGKEGQTTPRRVLPTPSPASGILRNLLVSSAARAPGAIATP